MAPQDIVISESSFALNGSNMAYRFHVDQTSGDLLLDHFGGKVTQDHPIWKAHNFGGSWSKALYLRREFPDLGHGDFREPAIHVRHSQGHTVSAFKYQSHVVVPGKPKLDGLPCTFGTEDEVRTVIVRMRDIHNAVAAELSYSVFPEHDAIVRSVKIINEGEQTCTVEKAASFSFDLPNGDYDMIGLHGDWGRERAPQRRKIYHGVQGFQSTTGYSSHFHNPFLAICDPDTTESRGDAWGLLLVHSGSFKAEVDSSPIGGPVRAMIGMNPLQLSWDLAPGESLVTPECISVYSSSGIGGMSRQIHRMLNKNLIKSKFASQPRPPLLNCWEGVYFNFDQDIILKLAEDSKRIGAKLFIVDDGWFGNKHARTNERGGLGDWQPNLKRFPQGLKPMVDKITNDIKIQFGIWVEPEMVNPNSELYENHPDWVMYAADQHRTEARSQLVLNLGLKDVQNFIIDFMTELLRSAPISYIKWDNNRAIMENASPRSYHEYMLGLYHVFETLTSRFPDVLWEGCASGGGRFDAGILHYFPQVWTSDNTDAVDRIAIQLGTSLAYPASTMGAHISAVPNHETGRITSIQFRAHVAMMGGSFGLELDSSVLSQEDRDALPALLELAEEVNPVVIQGDMYRLRLPQESNLPAVLFVAPDRAKAVLFQFQIRDSRVQNWPTLQLQGLDPKAMYEIKGLGTFEGATLMYGGMQTGFNGDFDSKVMVLNKVEQ